MREISFAMLAGIANAVLWLGKGRDTRSSC
jgi:hypothetical protein